MEMHLIHTRALISLYGINRQKHSYIIKSPLFNTIRNYNMAQPLKSHLWGV